MKADEPPRRDMPTATLAGAPPGAFLNAGASANESPFVVGTKSISISPKQTTREDSSISGELLLLANALPTAKTFDKKYHKKRKRKNLYFFIWITIKLLAS